MVRSNFLRLVYMPRRWRQTPSTSTGLNEQVRQFYNHSPSCPENTSSYISHVQVGRKAA